ncbi:MAG TPA: DUF899 domain-containing protein [Polyangiales bacterium]|nr:DUF899 domain-containing protein [Polyangiales bacterium]
MEMPRVVSREQWLAARRELLEREKAATRERDALNAQRRQLPMVHVEKEYMFTGPSGRVRLLDLFAGRRQLIVLHVMFHAERDQACTGCSHCVDNLPHLAHLHARDTSLVLVSRAPLAQLAQFKRRMAWTAPWYSSLGSDFNYDFHVTTDPSVAPVEYNYRDQRALEQRGQSYHARGEQPGVSVFLRDESAVFHTYSTFGRGLESFLTTYHYLDLTPQGRGEGWGGMPDLGVGKSWLRHHDRYEEAD